MDGRFNTIAGWVLGAGIVFLGATLVTREVFKAHDPEHPGYAVNAAEEEGAGGAPAEQPIAFYLQTADAARGQRSFGKCQSCHTIAQGGANTTGPNLWGTMGETIGTGHGGYAFSTALSSHGGRWDWETMNAWLRSPREFAPGTKMTFAGLSNPQERADIMVYLNQNGGNLTLPPPPAAAPAEGNEAAGNEAAGNEAAPAGNAAAPAANAAAPAAAPAAGGH